MSCADASVHPGRPTVGSAVAIASVPSRKKAARQQTKRLLSLMGGEVLSAHFALLHEAGLRGTCERLAFRTHGLGSALVGHALLHEGGLGRTGKRFAVLAHGFALASILCEGGT